MLPLYILVAVSGMLLFLQIIRRVSLSHPVLVYSAIILFPVWCVYSAYCVLDNSMDLLDSYSTTGEGVLGYYLGSISGSAAVTLLLTLFLLCIPYLLFLVTCLKFNIFPYKRIGKCLPEEREAAKRISCARICRYALVMQVFYLSLSVFIIVKNIEDFILAIGVVTMGILPWGTAATLIGLILVPPLGLLAGVVVVGASALTLSPVIAAMLLIGVLLTAALITTLNATIRTCRFTQKRAGIFAASALLPVVNIGILIYLLACLIRKKENDYSAVC